MDIEDYILAHISPEPPHLQHLYRHTNLYHLYPHMCSGHLQGRLLAMLTAMIAPRNILELGTYTGYSTLCIAEAMPSDASLYTVEINDEMEPELTDTFAASPRARDIHLCIGDALNVVPNLPVTQWDMVFVDANKRDYPAYYSMLLPRLRPGGFMLVDNTLWGGAMALMDTPDAKHDAQTRGIARFNDMVAQDPNVDVVILPLRDGLTLIRKKTLH